MEFGIFVNAQYNQLYQQRTYSINKRNCIGLWATVQNFNTVGGKTNLVLRMTTRTGVLKRNNNGVRFIV